MPRDDGSAEKMKPLSPKVTTKKWESIFGPRRGKVDWEKIMGRKTKGGK